MKNAKALSLKSDRGAICFKHETTGRTAQHQHGWRSTVGGKVISQQAVINDSPTRFARRRHLHRSNAVLCG